MGSPLPFPSPSTILGGTDQDHDHAPPADISLAAAAPPPQDSHKKKDTDHARRPSKDNAKKIAAPRKASAADAAKDPAAKPKQTKSRNGTTYQPATP